MTEVNLPAGLRADGEPRTGATGVWWRALAPGGGERGVLRFNLEGADGRAPNRLAAAVQAVERLDYSGFLSCSEVLRHEGDCWVISAQPATPTLVQLAQAPITGIDIGCVATIANETAQSLAELHSAGLCHGALDGHTVVVTTTGAAKMAEAGLLPALRGEQINPAEAARTDRIAWASLVRAMVVEWGGDAPGAELLQRCAAIGEQDLGAAVQELHAGVSILPPGFSKRARLVAAVAAFTGLGQAPGTVNPAMNQAAGSGATPAAAPAVPMTPPQAMAAPPVGAAPPVAAAPPVGAAPAGAAMPADGMTRMARRGSASPDAAVAPAVPERQETRLARRPGAVPRAEAHVPVEYAAGSAAPYRGGAPAYANGAPAYGVPGQQQGYYGQQQQQQYGEARFGPGVSSVSPAPPGWRSAPVPPAPAKRKRSPLRLISSILSILLTLVLLVVAGWYLLQRISPMNVSAVEVAVPSAPGKACNVTVDVVGTVNTNGRPGTIKYQWQQSGEDPQPVQQYQTWFGKKTIQLHLLWQISGPGTATETATLHILEPGPTQEASAKFTYTCRS